MSINPEYGYYESNPLPKGFHENFTEKASRSIRWNDPELDRIVRLRLLTDPGFPLYDVSYCYGITKDGEPVEVELPFSQLSKGRGKRSWQSDILRHAKRDGVYAKRHGLLHEGAGVISILR
jgi:hypothetical protein